MTRIPFYLMVPALLATVASAEQYRIACEGDDFPENEARTRLWNRPPDGQFAHGGPITPRR